MIITKTPFRMSFFGGGTDMESFFAEHGGAVLSTTFDKFCYVNVRHLPRFFEYNNQVIYSKIENTVSEADIQHPLIRNAMEYLHMHNLRIAYDADLPARTGLGTSSSFAVGLLSAFYALKGKYVDKKTLAKEAIYVERVLCDEAGGWQDQIAAAYGGFNVIRFEENQFSVTPVIISPEKKKQLQSNLMLFFTGFSRYSSQIQQDTMTDIRKKTKDLLEMLSLVGKARSILETKESDLDEFGRLLDYTWKLKRGIGKTISTSDIDMLYDKAVSAGALGGKLLGAGGGGFLLFYVQEDKQQQVEEALKNLLRIPFQFENEGTQILYYHPEEYKTK